MSERENVAVTLPADVQQIDHTGFVWAFLDEADEPERVQAGALIVAGDSVEPFWPALSMSSPARTAARSSDVVGVPDQAIDALRHAHLLPR